MSTTLDQRTDLDKIEHRATIGLLREYDPAEQLTLPGETPYPWLYGAISRHLPADVRDAAEALLNRWHDHVWSDVKVCDCGHAPHSGRVCAGEPDTGPCGHDTTEIVTAAVFDECPLEDCGHRHDPDEPCMVAVEIDGQGERPCGCRACPVCHGHGVQVHADTWRGGVRERTCPACSGTGQA